MIKYKTKLKKITKERFAFLRIALEENSISLSREGITLAVFVGREVMKTYKTKTKRILQEIILPRFSRLCEEDECWQLQRIFGILIVAKSERCG